MSSRQGCDFFGSRFDEAQISSSRERGGHRGRRCPSFFLTKELAIPLGKIFLERSLPLRGRVLGSSAPPLRVR